MDKKDIEKIGIEIKNYHDSNIKKILLLKIGSIIYLNTSSYEYIKYLENIVCDNSNYGVTLYDLIITGFNEINNYTLNDILYIMDIHNDYIKNTINIIAKNNFIDFKFDKYHNGYIINEYKSHDKKELKELLNDILKIKIPVMDL